MNDPHVVALQYTLTDGEAHYEDPPAISFERDDFSVTLSAGKLITTMKAHTASAGQAMALVDPLLQAWEIESALVATGTPQVSFQFDRAEMIDRNPPPPGESVMHAGAGVIALTGSALAFGVAVRRTYPPPPTIQLNPHVETMWFRYSLYKSGRDSLIGAAYFCFTFLKHHYRGTAKAEHTLGISHNVLKTLRRLLNRVGDKATARKVSVQPRPITRLRRMGHEIPVLLDLLRNRALAIVIDHTELALDETLDGRLVVDHAAFGGNPDRGAPRIIDMNACLNNEHRNRCRPRTGDGTAARSSTNSNRSEVPQAPADEHG